MPNRTSAERAACLDQPRLFQHELLEEPAIGRQDGDRQRQRMLLTARAAAVCAGCPLFESCLYQAVVVHDVAGFVAGTTGSQRAQLRAGLGVTVGREDFDTLAGVVRGNRSVDHDEVLRLRKANPDESLEVIAMRLGCSLSTVKRHLRRARAAAPAEVALSVVKPTVSQVMDAYTAVLGAPPRRRQQRVA